VTDNGKNIVRVSVRMDADLHARLAEIVHKLKMRGDRKKSMDWAVQDAVGAWVGPMEARLKKAPAQPTSIKGKSASSL